ncbi:carboxypeptidase B-like [Photinus pyralis]|uniref:carboxypeptidase B-like n=1 Tax=Photinus pyralis TaxID=7054 RepID=UPI001266F307|nr:carboxypeptidase B-like [Photinus pyralis]
MRFFVILSIVVAAAWAKSYDGYKLYRLHPTSKDQVELLKKIENADKIDFWSHLRFSGQPIDVMVEPTTQDAFTWFLNMQGIKYDIAIDNIERIVNEERMQQMLAPRSDSGSISFSKFNRFEEINAYMDKLAADYPKLVQLETIGQTTEGREMRVIQISTKRGSRKPVIFVDAGIHAREWLAPAQALYLIKELVENEANRHLLEKVDWHILPVFNPDGYEYSHTKARFWRKTRSNQGACKGTDANRNFGYHWGEVGTSDSSCSDIFRGPSAFSEPESRAVRDYILYRQNQIKLYLTFHSYGNYLLYPWGFTSALPHDDKELRSLGEKVNNAIVAAGGNSYTIGTSTNVLYPAAGGTDDWAKGVAGVELAYTIELPAGGSGFDPAPSQILGHVQQTFEGIKEFGKYIEYKFA